MRKSLRLPLAIGAAVAVAELGVLLFRPRDTGPKSVVLDPANYFTAAQLDRAQHFRSGQLILFGVSTLIELGVLIYLVRRPPALLKREFKRPVLAGAVAAAGLSALLTLVVLPVSVIARERAKDVGLITQSLPGWVLDLLKSQGVNSVIAAAGGAALIFGMRRLGSRWWIAGAVVIVGFGVAITYAGPVLIDPLFNKFQKLPAGETRSQILELSEKAGVDVKDVYEVDASRRTTAANAYVNGIGRTKRVVLYDTLLKDFTPEELRLVVAHELSHVKNNDIPHGLLYLLLIAPFGTLAIALLTDRLAPKGSLGKPLVLPAAVLSIALLVPVITAISNQLSRAVERRADYFALELTKDPAAMIDFERRITVKNVSNPDPPKLLTFLLGTHPSTMERIGLAEALRRKELDQSRDR